MANRLVLRAGDRARLQSLARADAAVARRAGIVLLAADGLANSAIAERLGVTRRTVIKWRTRYQKSGLAGLDDLPRAGRPRRVDPRAILAATLKPPPRSLGVSHWTSRLLAAHLGVSDATVTLAWRDFGIHPHGPETFAFATDPELVGRVTDIVGLSLAPGTRAIALHLAETPSDDQPASDLHGAEFQAFSAFAREPTVHVVLDSPAVAPNLRVHSTTTPESWPNLVETWLAIVGQRATGLLNAMIRADRAQPFVWINTPAELRPRPPLPQKPPAAEPAPVPIRTVADGFDIPFSTLHYWERQGLIAPHRQGRQRHYDLAQIRRIALVQLWRETGMLTIDDISTILAAHEPTTDWRQTVGDRINAINEQMDRLSAAQSYLSHLLTCPHEPLEECPDFQAMVSSHIQPWYDVSPPSQLPGQ